VTNNAVDFVSAVGLTSVAEPEVRIQLPPAASPVRTAERYGSSGLDKRQMRLSRLGTDSSLPPDYQGFRGRVSSARRCASCCRLENLVRLAKNHTISGGGVHVAAVRKALGDGREGNRFIVSDPGRGYSFVAPVTREKRQGGPAPTPNQPARSGNLPVLLTRVVGRDEVPQSTFVDHRVRPHATD
jgi:hypothetical protein